MNAHDDFIMSYPTGKWNLGNTLEPNVIVKNVKTSEQASAEKNKQTMQNKFISDNIESPNEGFTNYENFTSCKNTNPNTNFLSGIIIGFSVIFIFIYILFQIIIKK